MNGEAGKAQRLLLSDVGAKVGIHVAPELQKAVTIHASEPSCAHCEGEARQARRYYAADVWGWLFLPSFAILTIGKRVKPIRV
jgi:hypothetical protein